MTYWATMTPPQKRGPLGLPMLGPWPLRLVCAPLHKYRITKKSHVVKYSQQWRKGSLVPAVMQTVTGSKHRYTSVKLPSTRTPIRMMDTISSKAIFFVSKKYRRQTCGPLDGRPVPSDADGLGQEGAPPITARYTPNAGAPARSHDGPIRRQISLYDNRFRGQHWPFGPAQ